MKSAGAELENVIKFNIYISQGQNPQDGFQAFQEKWNDRENFPTITVLFVSGFVNPDWLVEIDAIAVMQE